MKRFLILLAAVCVFAPSTLHAQAKVPQAPNDLKGAFETGDVPSQTDFENLIDATVNRTVDVRSYGASSTATAAVNAAAIQLALDTGLPVTGGGDSYAIDTALTWYSTTGETLELSDITLVPDSAIVALTVASTATQASTTLTSAERVGATVITVASSTGIAVGDIIKLSSDVLWPFDPRGALYKGEVGVVASISVNDITLVSPLACDYNAPTETVTVTARKPIGVKFRGVLADYGGTQRAENLVSLSYVRDVSVVGSSFSESTTSSLGLAHCFGGRVSETTFLDTWDGATGTGYGCQANQCTGIVFSSITASNCRRAIDFSGNVPCHDMTVASSTIYGLISNNGSCLGTHGGANNTKYIGNTLIGGGSGIHVRSPNTQIIGNTFRAPYTTCILHSSGEGLIAEGNFFPLEPRSAASGQPNVAMSSFYLLQSTDGQTTDLFNNTSATIVIKGNVGAVRSDFLDFKSSVTAPKRFYCEGNTVAIQSNSSGLNTSFLNCDATTVFTDSIIDNNNVLDSIGTYQEIRGSVSFATSRYRAAESTTPQMFGAITDDEVDDTAAITAAFAASNGTVLFPPGIYLTDQIDIATANTKVTGKGATLQLQSTEISVINITASGVTIEGLKIDADDNAYIGINIADDAGNVRIENCEIFDVSHASNTIAGIFFGDGCHGFTATGNYIHDIYSSGTSPSRGIRGAGATAPTVGVRRVVISNNRIDNVYPVDDGDGIVIQDWTDVCDVTVSNNVFSRCAKRAVKIMSPGVAVTGNVIRNEDVATDPRSGIALYADDCVASGNRIYGPVTNSGIEVTGAGIVASGNTMNFGSHANTVADGIQDGGVCTGLTLLGNSIRGTHRYGVNLDSACVGVQIASNSFNGGSKSVIHLTGSCTNLAISGNTAKTYSNYFLHGDGTASVVAVTGNASANMSFGALGTLPTSLTMAANTFDTVTVPSADVLDITDSINTKHKFEGKVIYNSTTSKPIYADGSAAGDVWRNADGTVAYTPL